jgi:hypothetical protein
MQGILKEGACFQRTCYAKSYKNDREIIGKMFIKLDTKHIRKCGMIWAEISFTR